MIPFPPLDESLPGAELVRQGLADLAAGRQTELSLLCKLAGPRLRALGIDIPAGAMDRPAEHLLYELLEARLGTGAHSFYNSLIRRIVSYARALERERSIPLHPIPEPPAKDANGRTDPVPGTET